MNTEAIVETGERDPYDHRGTVGRSGAARPGMARAGRASRAAAAPPPRGAAVVAAAPPPRGAGVPGRRTVTIQGRGSERYSSTAGRRRPTRRPHERDGFRPDRAAMWAVLLGVVLVLVAATSSHAAMRAQRVASAAQPVALPPHHATVIASAAHRR